MRSLHLFVYSFRRCHPILLCRIHPLPRVPWMWKVKNRIMFYLHSTKMFMSHYSSAKNGYHAFWGSEHMEATICIYVATPCWQLFVTHKTQRTKGHPKHDSPIHHLPHLWLRRNFFEKIGNIFLHYLVAFSSCDTRFEEEKWELSQLEYSGKMQLLQRYFDMEKTYVDVF